MHAGEDRIPARLALVGLGEHGSSILLPALRTIPIARLEAICDQDERCLWKQEVRGFKIEGYTSFNAMLEEHRLDGLILAGPPQMHELISRSAIERGISVFVEKPPSVTGRTLQELAAQALAHNVQTGVGLNFRFAEPVRLIKRYIEKRNLHVISISIKHTSSKPRAGLWGLDRVKSFLLAQVIHPLDTLIFFGGAVNDVRADSYIGDTDFTLSINMTFTSGAMGHLITGSDSPRFDTLLEIITAEDVVIKLDNMWRLTVLDQDILPLDLDDRKRWRLDWEPSPLNSGFVRSGYYNELFEFCACLLDGGAFSPSFSEVIFLYDVLEKVEGILRSH